MTHLDLFSGIGGFALAARWAGIETVQFVENEPYAQKILAKNFPDVPIAGDIFGFDATEFLGVGLITGGFPCQPFSQAGKQLGKEDDRAIWPQMFRVIREARPTWVLGENVAGIIAMELDNVLSDLESEGYTTQTLVIPACAVDAKHRRDRVWIVAYPSSIRCSERADFRGEIPEEIRGGEFDFRGTTSSEDVADSKSNDNIKQNGKTDTGRKDVSRWQAEIRPELTGCSEDVADSTVKRLERTESARELSRGNERLSAKCSAEWWSVEPSVGRVAHGIPRRVDRLRGLGNAIVPQVAFEILNKIVQID